MSGLFITFEGVEGSGKTTQLELLRQYLDTRGCSILLTREPGGTPTAEAIRNVLLDTANKELVPMAELLLYAAARAQHVEERIRPALEAGMIVLCDRFSDSTTAYQGIARGLSLELLGQLHHIATNNLRPHLTFLLDMDPEAGLARTRNRGRNDRIEQESIAFHRRVRDGFLAIADNEPERVLVLDASQELEVLAREIQGHLDAFLQRRAQEQESGIDS